MPPPGFILPEVEVCNNRKDSAPVVNFPPGGLIYEENVAPAGGVISKIAVETISRPREQDLHFQVMHTRLARPKQTGG